MATSLLIFSDPVEVPLGVTELAIAEPTPGARFLNAYVVANTGTGTLLEVSTVNHASGVLTLYFNGAAPVGHSVVVVWEDPNTAESFAPQKSWTFVTKSFISSCDCGCGGNTPIKVGEFIGIKVNTTVDPSGVIKALVQAAHRDRTDPSTWVYTLGIQDPDLVLSKAVVLGFSCCV